MRSSIIWILLTSQINSTRSRLFNMISVKHTSGMYVVLARTVTLSMHASCCYAAILAGDYHQEGWERRYVCIFIASVLKPLFIRLAAGEW